MKLNLSENIRLCRRDKNLTQEQLAEALNVTVGAVSKWESGANTPELETLVRIADFFDLSVDALLGWRLEGGSLNESIGRIKALLDAKNFDEAVTQSEKLLQKHPNNFEVVHHAALAYRGKGVSTTDKAILHRAIELFHRALSLIDQNTDPKVTAWQIKNRIGEMHACLEEIEQAVKIYQENNVNGINDARIAQALSDNLKRHDEALPYARRAFHRMTEDMISSAVAIATSKKDADHALACLQWLVRTLEGLRPDDGFCETDFAVISLMFSIGEILADQGQRAAAKEWMLRARRLAIAYDTMPQEKLVTCRFFNDTEPIEHYYYLCFSGTSAVRQLENRLNWGTPEQIPEYHRLWDEITREIEREESK